MPDLHFQGGDQNWGVWGRRPEKRNPVCKKYFSVGITSLQMFTFWRKFGFIIHFFRCHICGVTFVRKYYLESHLMTFHMVGLQTQNNSTEIYSSLSDQVQANTSITKQQIGNIPSYVMLSRCCWKSTTKYNNIQFQPLKYNCKRCKRESRNEED